MDQVLRGSHGNEQRPSEWPADCSLASFQVCSKRCVLGALDMVPGDHPHVAMFIIRRLPGGEGCLECESTSSTRMMNY